MENKTSKSSASHFTKTFFSQFATSKEQMICVSANDSLSDAAKLMRKNHVGDIVVCEQVTGKKTPVGIITDRDITIESLGQGVNPDSIKVSDIMSRSLATASPEEDLFGMIAKMKENGVNRLPIVDQDGNLAGIVTSKKIVQCLIQGLQDLSSLSTKQRGLEKEHRH